MLRGSIFSVSGGRRRRNGSSDKDARAGPPTERKEGLIVLLRSRGLKSKQAGWMAGCIESRLKEFKQAIAHTAGIGSVIFSYN